MSETPCDTIVLIHGLWVTPRSWEHWKQRFEALGYRVLTPAYPGFEVEVEALRENPDVIADLTVPQTVEHLAGVIESLETPPVIIGHSFGGILTQLLLSRGLGAAGVVIDSAPTEGVRVTPLSQAKKTIADLDKQLDAITDQRDLDPISARDAVRRARKSGRDRPTGAGTPTSPTCPPWPLRRRRGSHGNRPG